MAVRLASLYPNFVALQAGEMRLKNPKYSIFANKISVIFLLVQVMLFEVIFLNVVNDIHDLFYYLVFFVATFILTFSVFWHYSLTRRSDSGFSKEFEFLIFFGGIGYLITYFDKDLILSRHVVNGSIGERFLTKEEWPIFVNVSTFVVLGIFTLAAGRIYLLLGKKYALVPPKWIRYIRIFIKNIVRFFDRIRESNSDFDFHIIFWIYLALIINDYKLASGYIEKVLAFVFCILLFYFTMFFRLYREDLLNRKVFMSGRNRYENIYVFLVIFFFVFCVFEITLFEAIFSRKIPKDQIDGLLIFNFGLVLGGILAAVSERSNRLNKQRLFEASEKQRVADELSASLSHRMHLLNSQIGSHFFFNCLNFIRRKSDVYSSELSKVIVLLSNVIRNALESTKPSRNEAERKRVSLVDEIASLREFIEFYQLISEEQVHVDFATYGSFSYMTITPLLLVTFVENAFKYGDLTRPDDPLKMQLVVVEGELTFTVKNKKKRASMPGDVSTRIGLHNVETRLRYEYPDNYKLNISDTRENFIVNLQLTL